MLNKKAYSGGGLCLVNPAVIAVSTLSVVKAEGIDEARNTLIQLYWRIQANNIIEDTKWKVVQKQIENKSWFINPKLDESIKKVVGKAIADCVTNMGYFKNKKAGEIIELKFKGEKTPATYEQKHWNAVMLWNYVNDAIKGNESNGQAILEDCSKRILQHYSHFDNEVKNLILIAKKVIDSYVKDLNLDSNLATCKPYYNKNNKNNLFYSVPRCNEIVTYLPETEIFSWRAPYVSIVKTLNTVEFDYKIGVGLGITGIKEQYWTLRENEFQMEYGFEFVWYEPRNIEYQLKKIHFADLLSDLQLKIYSEKELEDELVERYEKIRETANEYVNFDSNKYEIIHHNNRLLEYEQRLIQDRYNRWFKNKPFKYKWE